MSRATTSRSRLRGIVTSLLVLLLGSFTETPCSPTVFFFTLGTRRHPFRRVLDAGGTQAHVSARDDDVCHCGAQTDDALVDA
jgi:hypothetical protein